MNEDVFIFPIEDGDFPAWHVSFPEGCCFFLVWCSYLKFSTTLWSWKIPKESPICVIKLGRCLPPKKNSQIDEINQKMVNTQFFTKPIYNIGEHPHYFLGGGLVEIFHPPPLPSLGPPPFPHRSEVKVLQNDLSCWRVQMAHHIYFQQNIWPNWDGSLGQQKLIGGWMKWMKWMDLMDFCTIIVLHHHCCHYGCGIIFSF